ncbi:thioredoxin domain-containing protein [Clostridium sp. C8-1-8]|uniref:thioredoxin domain-containing protein n=1 Tax=Clostridium sp. C8-1-8 TaxID=2698831 RepID=UPI001369B0B8|nr:thioredoxin domain-containing protein [Clostridium sp. C8-1-8]
MNLNTTTNRLADEKSPYLLQHAHNPVDWHPWNEEAFEKAKKEDKPIFLSIGYSTCHWCHVMAHESFEDEEVARLMNETFISIKVDREERPDIDNIYMTVCQMLTGHGGWPLTIIMTPDKKPFFAGTYIPKNSKYGRIGMIELTNKTKELWRDEKDRLFNSAEDISSRIKEAIKSTPGDVLGKETVELCFKQLVNNFDKVNGGFSSSPKFPTPHNLLFLMRYYHIYNNEDALDMVTKTLDKMSIGGIHDHIGYGFHRYSTDSKWLLPHFEKMLYDQAMLILAYTDCYNITKNPYYKEVAENTISYCERVLLSPEGAFYSAEDADSEGEEGKFYVWSIKELKDVLDDQELQLLSKIYNLKDNGNFKDEATGKFTGYNILHLKEKLSDITCEKYDDNLYNSLNKIKETLFKKREQRVHPHLDDKILTDWNGLMIAALSRAAAVFNKKDYSMMAKQCIDFFINNMKSNSVLYHRYCKGEWNIPGNLDDYSFMIFALIELYEATFETRYLQLATELTNHQVENFWDEEGGFYFTSSKEEEVLARVKEIYDGAIPSGNSVAFMNMLKLSKLTGNAEYEGYCEKLQKAFSQVVKDSPIAYTQLVSGILLSISSSTEIVVVGNTASDEFNNYVNSLRSIYSPTSVILGKDSNDKDPLIHKLADYTKYQQSVDHYTTVYVCKNFTCSEPTTNLEEAMKLILENK